MDNSVDNFVDFAWGVVRNLLRVHVLHIPICRPTNVSSRRFTIREAHLLLTHYELLMEKWDLFTQLSDLFAPMDCNQQVETYWALLEDCPDEQKPMLTEIAGFVSIAVFAKVHLSDYTRLPFGVHHKAFFEAIPRGERGQKVNILAPRGSGKSTVITVFYPLHCIYYKYLYEEFGMKSERYILILSRSYGNAMDRIKDIKSEIEMRGSLQHLKGNDTWGEMRSITANDILLVPQSRGGKVRGSLYKGFRPTLVLPDDLDDIDSIRNPNTLQKDEDWFNSDLMECGDADTNFICVDTVKAERAIANQLRYRPAWRNIFIQAIPNPDQLVHPDAEQLWQAYRKIYANTALEPQERSTQMEVFWTEHEKEMNAGVEETWREKWTYRSLREKEFDQGRAAILREYQNHPVDRELAIFDMENAVRFTVENDGLLRSDERLVRWERLSGATIFLDWAGIKESLDNCFAAVVAVLWEPVPGGVEARRRGGEAIYSDMRTYSAYGYVYQVWMERGSRGKQIEALCDVYRNVYDFLALRSPARFNLHLCCEDFVDTTGDQKENFLRHYESISLAKEISTPLQFLPRQRNKEERIASLEAPIDNGWLAFHKELPKPFMDQMREFPICDFNDGPDSCEGAWSYKITETENERQARRNRANQRVQESHLLKF